MHRPVFRRCMCVDHSATAFGMVRCLDNYCLGCASAAAHVCDGFRSFSFGLRYVDGYAHAAIVNILLSGDLAVDMGKTEKYCGGARDKEAYRCGQRCSWLR